MGARRGVTPTDMLDAIFAEIDRLDAVDPADEGAIQREVGRARAVSGLAMQANAMYRTILDAAAGREDGWKVAGEAMGFERRALGDGGQDVVHA